ncbi:MAG TPA: type II secretion system protein GspM [Rhodanobacteraceae bacterium]
MRKLTPVESRVSAWLLVLVVLALAWWLLVQWWFVTPLLQTDGQIQSLRDEQQSYAALVAQRDVLQHQLAGLSQDDADASAFLAGGDPNAATAALMQRTVEIVGAHAALGPCKVTQKMPVPTQGDDHAPYRKVSASINMRCGMAPLAAVLYDLAHDKPYLFVDNFNAFRNPRPGKDGTTQPLNVQLTLSGYMHQASGRQP